MKKNFIIILISLLIILISCFLIIKANPFAVVGTPIESPASADIIENSTPPESLPSHPKHRGTSVPIPDAVKESMEGISMKKNPNITYDDLRYLTIPHYDFSYNVTEGHLIVDANIAEEVLDIFAELFDIRYPIERMELIDKYNADDFTSIEFNNTSAFNYRLVSTGTGKLSNHAYGRAIDINPQINPYVYSNGEGAHKNARNYWQRDINLWPRDIDRAAYIGSDTEIYKIFKKYGWIWGGDWSPEKDYQHFEK